MIRIHHRVPLVPQAHEKPFNQPLLFSDVDGIAWQACKLDKANGRLSELYAVEIAALV